MVERDGQVCGMKLQTKQTGLTGNQLKIIAIISMLLDHIGVDLLPQYPVLRVLGRFALPIFAFMIAEGCRYTRSRKDYLLKIAGLGLVCQLVFYLATGDTYQGILITFSLSIASIYGVDLFLQKRDGKCCVVMVLILLAVLFLTVAFPIRLRGSGFEIDYGLPGVLLPVAIYYGRNQREKLLLAAVMLGWMGLVKGGIFWFSLLALPLLALYNGTRGKARIKYLFYVFYPSHLAAIYAIGMLL